MTGWIIAAALYVLGGFGLYAVVCDLNRGPIKTRWKRALFLVWPIVVVIQGGGDIFDRADGDGPSWTRGR